MIAACSKCGRMLYESHRLFLRDRWREICAAVSDATEEGCWAGGVTLTVTEHRDVVRATGHDPSPERTLTSTLVCPSCQGMSSWPVLEWMR